MEKQNGMGNYNKTVTLGSAEKVVGQYGGLVKKIAYHLLARLPKTVLLEDLIQSGIVGLLEARQKFNFKNKTSFSTFASNRIKGAMIDDLRKVSWAPRSVHQNMRKVSEAIRCVENKKGTQATSGEVALQLGITLQEYASLTSKTYVNELVSFDGTHEGTVAGDKINDDPCEKVSQDDLKACILGIGENFPKREQIILNMHYTNKLNFKDIGEVLEITGARVSQLHAQAIARFKARLTG